MSARKIAYNAITQIGGKFLGLFVSSFILVIVASKLGTAGMGDYTTVVAFVGFFVTLADLGINIIMSRELAQHPDNREAITGEFLGFRLVYSLFIMILAPIVALVIPTYRNSDIIVEGITIVAMAQFVLLVNQNFTSILQVQLQLDRAAFAEIANRVLTLALIAWGATIYNDLRSFFFYLLWVTVVAAVLNTAITYFFAAKHWRIRPNFNAKKWRHTMHLLAPMGIFTFLGMLHFKADTIILSLFRSSYDVGIYGYAYKIAEIMFSVPIMFIGTAFPRMSVLYKDNKAEFLRFTQQIFSILFFITLPLIGGIYVLAPYLTTLLSRQSAYDGILSGRILQILTLAMLFWFFEALYHHILLIARSYPGLIKNLVIVVVLNLGLNFVFIPYYSYYAAAIITVLSGLIMLILSGIYCRQTTEFSPQLKGLMPVVIATTCMMGGVAWAQRQWGSDLTDFVSASRSVQFQELIAYVLLGTFLYCAVLLVWGKSSPLYILGRQLRKSSPL